MLASNRKHLIAVAYCSFWLTYFICHRQYTFYCNYLINKTYFRNKSFFFLYEGCSTNNFRWIWLVFEDPRGGLLFYVELIRIDPWFVTCNDLINVFWSNAIVFVQHFFTPIDTGSNENQSSLRPGVHAILNVCWWKKCG